MAGDDKSTYDIGYKKPPESTRFKPGQSGNPKGKSKGTKNFATVLQKELKSFVVVTEGGKRKKISKREAIAKQLVNKAAAGDPKAIPILFNETRVQENLPPDVSPQDTPTRQEDRMVMTSIINRIRAAQDIEVQPEPVKDAAPEDKRSSSPPQTEQEPKP